MAGGINGFQYVPNPTGWIDPLGLSTCPGGDGCRPSTTGQQPITGVDHGEPALPQLTRAQRQEKIDELTEANAKRRVLEQEKKYDMHMVGKHGPEVENVKMRRRSIDGTDPITGITPKNKKGVPALSKRRFASGTSGVT